ncbi:PREDICTED: rab11 family-interacting protein 2 isoform X2 [Nicrophorus vespilloides]|uniref:Rab11 family-interacting protein 2 isoform X2 n=1 Tax=Nicrophorus vespilloides TaxID=110193 RepID=A0ABM1MNW4_NICVS|nr:PREDICTED: rab11 family-interacting protein 2 isoform X2 [Nicrophorus vespilloides]
MWMPTHVQVTVQRATDLLVKGKNNTNDCFVTIALGKTKYQTSVKKKAEPSVEWHEECELPIPEQGNTAEIALTVLHQNFLGVDEFLGRVTIPLNTLDTYERPKNRWYTLQSKPGKEDKSKERGKLEVKVAFTVKSGSLTDLSKKEKHKSSVGQLSQMAHSVGGSLLSIGSVDKRKGLKKFAKSIGSKMHLKGKKKDDFDDNSSMGSVASLRRSTIAIEPSFKSKQTFEDADPGVVSDEEDDFMFDDLSHKSSASSLNQPPQTPKLFESNDTLDESMRRKTLPPSKPPRFEAKTDEWEMKLNKNKSNLKPSSLENLNRRSWESPKLSTRIEEEDISEQQEDWVPGDSVSIKSKSPELAPKIEKESIITKLRNLRKDKNDDKTDKNNERVIIGGENDSPVTTNNRISNELLQKFEGKSREDVILMLCEVQSDLDHNKKKLKDLEDYLDDLLLRVMETTPRILQNPPLSHQYINNASL